MAKTISVKNKIVKKHISSLEANLNEKLKS